jgi:hypothetical protein
MGLPDKIVSINAILSDGSQVVLGNWLRLNLSKRQKEAAENSIYKRLYEELSVAATQEEIKISKARNSPS